MAVITHARVRPHTVDYTLLPTTVQEKFDQLMVQADTAGTTGHFLDVMREAADLLGVQLPPSGDIRRCACSCYCGEIFDAEDPDAHVIEESAGYNLGRMQCPTCTDRHQETA